MSMIPRIPEDYRCWWAEQTDIPYGFCWCGCGQPTAIAKETHRRSGHIAGEPVRFIQGHANRRSVKWREEDRGYESPCWIWQCRRDGAGYGQLWHKNKLTGAHRWVYQIYGNNLTDAESLHHLCGVPLCVNPSHVTPLTRSEHHGLHARGANNSNHRIPHSTVDAIRSLLEGGSLRQQDIADRFGVHQTTVSRIKRDWGMYGN